MITRIGPRHPMISMSKTMKTNSLRVTLTLTSLWFSFGIAYAQCKPGDILVGEDADNYYCMERSRSSTAQHYGIEFCHAKIAVGADQNAIRALGFATDAERFELYAGVASTQKA